MDRDLTASPVQNAAAEGRLLAILLARQNHVYVAVSFADDSYGRTAAAAFKSTFEGQFGGTITGFNPHQIGKKEYLAEAATLAALGGDILVVFADFDVSERKFLGASLHGWGFDAYAVSSHM